MGLTQLTLTSGKAGTRAQMPQWKALCDGVMRPAEENIIKKIEEKRVVIDIQSCQQKPQDWHFWFTQDVRNYLVYYIVDAVVGLVRHGPAVKDMLVDERFWNLVNFVILEEQYCFNSSENGVEYFRSMTNRMLRLTNLVDLKPISDQPEDVDIPELDLHNPVDDLFNLFGDSEDAEKGSTDTVAPMSSLGVGLLQPVEETLTIMQERVERAKADNANHDMPDMSAVVVWRELCEFDDLGDHETRMKKFAAAVQSITHKRPTLTRSGQVADLFGRHVFFIPQPEDLVEVQEFQRWQDQLTWQNGSQDIGTYLALRKCPAFVPLVKHASFLPEAILNCIEKKSSQVRRYLGDPDAVDEQTSGLAVSRTADSADDTTRETSSSNEGEAPTAEGENTTAESDNVAGNASTPESALASGGEPSASSRESPFSDVYFEKSAESATFVVGEDEDDGMYSCIGKEHQDALTINGKSPMTYVGSSEWALQDQSKVFRVWTNGQLPEYHCPVLGFLPLMPVLHVRVGPVSFQAGMQATRTCTDTQLASLIDTDGREA